MANGELWFSGYVEFGLWNLFHRHVNGVSTADVH